MALPKDPVMLLSVTNTKLRDYYNTIEEFCEKEEISKEDLISTLEKIDYHYDKDLNQFK